MSLENYRPVIVVYNDDLCDIYLTNDVNNRLDVFLEKTMNVLITEQLRHKLFNLIPRCREFFDYETNNDKLFSKQIKDLSLENKDYCYLFNNVDFCFVCDFRTEETNNPILCYSYSINENTLKDIVSKIEHIAKKEDKRFLLKEFFVTTYSISDDRSIVYLDKSFVTKEHAIELAKSYSKDNPNHKISVFEHVNNKQLCIESFINRDESCYNNNIMQLQKVNDYTLEISNYNELSSNITSVIYSVSNGCNRLKVEWFFSDLIKTFYDKIHINDEFCIKLYQQQNNYNNKKYVIYDGVMILKNIEIKFDSYKDKFVIFSLLFED